MNNLTTELKNWKIEFLGDEPDRYITWTVGKIVSKDIDDPYKKFTKLPDPDEEGYMQTINLNQIVRAKRVNGMEKEAKQRAWLRWTCEYWQKHWLRDKCEHFQQ